MAISQGGEAQLSQPRDPTSSVLMPPLPPEDALPHVEDAAMLQVVTLIEPKRVVIDRDR
jgi:hypothetical protein